MKSRLSVLPCLCIALAASHPARAATVSSSASLIVSEKLSIGVTQSLLIGGANLTTVQAPAIASPISLARAASGFALPTAQAGAVGQQLSSQVGRGGTLQTSFVIAGDSDRSVSISVPATVSLGRLGGDEQLQFDSQTSIAAGQLGQSRLGSSAEGSGQLAFDVGGRVRLDGDTVAGDYAGILRVTVQYN